MFSRTLLTPFKNRTMLAMTRRWATEMYRRAYFSTNVNQFDKSSETVIEDQHMYTPSKAIKIDKGTFTIFDNTKVEAWKFGAPYEIKETTVKNVIGIMVDAMCEYNILYLSFFPSALFALNLFYRVSHYMSRAITHMDLLSWGTKVRVQFKVGGEQIWDINHIYKEKDEKALVETLQEPFLYPVSVKDKGMYYFYGCGHQAIQDGELFRAVVNGRSISLD